jgi:hypothetical protein
MAISFGHDFHGVGSVTIGPIETVGEGVNAFTVRRISLYPEGDADGGLTITLYGSAELTVHGAHKCRP